MAGNNCAFCSIYSETLKRTVYLANPLLGIWPNKIVRNAEIHVDEIFIRKLYITGGTRSNLVSNNQKIMKLLCMLQPLNSCVSVIFNDIGNAHNVILNEKQDKNYISNVIKVLLNLYTSICMCVCAHIYTHTYIKNLREYQDVNTGYFWETEKIKFPFSFAFT